MMGSKDPVEIRCSMGSDSGFFRRNGHVRRFGLIERDGHVRGVALPMRIRRVQRMCSSSLEVGIGPIGFLAAGGLGFVRDVGPVRRGCLIGRMGYVWPQRI